MTKGFSVMKRRLSGLGARNSPARRSPMKTRRRSGLVNKAAVPPDVTANIRVAVRVRPENERELAGNHRSILEVVDERMLIFDPVAEDEGFFFHGKRQERRDLNKRAARDHKFTFDQVYAPSASNEDVFAGTTKDLVDVVFNGYNCSVFVYGATGAGKTHTMLGGPNNPGITFRTVMEIYRRIDECKEDMDCEIGISYLEIYNEMVIDLINPGKHLVIREDGKQGITIPGLMLNKPSGPDELLRILQFGNSNRTQHPTDANAESSRSHAVFQVFLKQKPKSAGLSANVKVAKLSMIDLAGSERGSATSSRGGERFREGANINKSLLALGNCINALAEGSKYVPYRNSKLTRLLKDSIGGNCRTVMIANVSPCSLTFEDTYNTLKYADRAKKIKTKLKKNVVSVDFHVAQYAKIVEDLKKEIDELKEKIKSLEDENETLKEKAGSGAPSGESEDLRKRLAAMEERQADYDLLQERLKQYESQKEQGESQWPEILTKTFQERKSLIEKCAAIDSVIKMLHLRIHHQKNIVARIEAIESEKKTECTSVLKYERSFKMLEKKLQAMLDKKLVFQRKFEENRKELDTVLSGLPESDPKRGLIDSEIKALLSSLEAKHLKKVVNQMCTQEQRSNTILLEALPQMTKNHLLLVSYGKFNSDEMQAYNEFSAKVHCSTIMWNDRLTSTNEESSEEKLGPVYGKIAHLDIEPPTGLLESAEESSLNRTKLDQSVVDDHMNVTSGAELIISAIEEELGLTDETLLENDADPEDAWQPPTPPKKLKSSRPLPVRVSPKQLLMKASDSTPSPPHAPNAALKILKQQLDLSDGSVHTPSPPQLSSASSIQTHVLPAEVTDNVESSQESPSSSMENSFTVATALDETFKLEAKATEDETKAVVSTSSLNETMTIEPKASISLPTLNETVTIASPTGSTKPSFLDETVTLESSTRANVSIQESSTRANVSVQESNTRANVSITDEPMEVDSTVIIHEPSKSRRETFNVDKPTTSVVMPDVVQELKASKPAILPKTAKTPPPMKRTLKRSAASASTSSLLRASDLLGGVKSKTQKENVTSSSTSTPGYMRATTAAKNKTSKSPSRDQLMGPPVFGNAKKLRKVISHSVLRPSNK